MTDVQDLIIQYDQNNIYSITLNGIQRDFPKTQVVNRVLPLDDFAQNATGTHDVEKGLTSITITTVKGNKITAGTPKNNELKEVWLENSKTCVIYGFTTRSNNDGNSVNLLYFRAIIRQFLNK